MNAMGIKGKIAFITGAAQGIGEAVARTLASQGAHIAAVDYNPEKLEKVVSSLKAEGCYAEAFPADVRDSAAIDEITARIECEMGPIDILVNVAGVLRPGLIHSLSDEEWEATFSVNSTGVFNASRSVSKYMMDRRSGSIVTVGSNAAGVPRTSMAAYASSKAAAVMFTKCLGLELAEYNIRCNIVSPGSTETDMQWSLWADENGAEQVIKGSLETFKTGIPLKKLAQPSDIANAVLFLVSGQAGHITMHNLCVDGGATLGV
ncbi:2,3-dihydro-2,3-dihydroxybenzoate dehydrogenase [Bacillus inaquosorum]|uniref:2,3-dihydro-2,3-dihydroxybenzoate dehydrogenase n=1 Tax=Bacillus inaquosorum TaxID=483913 RepID=A0A9Q4EPA1_9BACI|nr:2,3-dihydro-2,3-dihydroxybenzoate dehydrogenase [Bacillus inaquosorum]MCY7785404.1 2,3-dihydro-2,3-dihydroxybenzoate dehydrogenase [Bacillus inaquosorum]MCY7819131.1 2,3-dihydro-2,3-dihydroxybenzoate dehydrogenase [Bacillus inaquosorum]MCY7938963.1 2,3-dihydro-2,3-dihydroxybenzoate dehydrogenase [Bacillus inaquosorum]MCY8081868.1 2,3-dihydro-2,3-dihydroxybenzoate dehydrogenase [Bacillus inaquosorum]MCY8161087.1 2,3-dihydro-2,3-dihydroxybenzoate dehydrogenase [Bacillus inaquosorum]